MFAYLAKNIDAFSAKGHPAFAAVMHAGPWAYSPHQSGGTLAHHVGAPNKTSAYGEPIEAASGLLFLPPKEAVEPLALARPSASRPDAQQIDLACGKSIAILPAYLEPRRVLSGGRVGDPVTRYGILAREVLSRISDAAQEITVADAQLIDLCHAAIAITYRVTPDFIDWAGWLTTEDVDPILGAVMSGPKVNPAHEHSQQSGAV